MTRLRGRTPAVRPFPPAFRRGLRLEWLESRDVPATFFVDDGLVAGTALGALPATVQVTNDRDASNTLTDGDQVTIAVGETGTAATLTFRTTAAGVAAGGDTGVAFGTIQLALDAAALAAGTDTVSVAKGTYAESLIVASAVTLDGLTGIAADVKIDPAAGAGVTVTADGVTISDLFVSGATDGIASTAAVGTLTLTNLLVGDDPATGAVETNTGIGLSLTGSGAAGSTLTLTNVRVAGNAGQGLAVSGFETVTAADLALAAATGATQSSITFPAAAAAATLNLSSSATAGQTFTVTGTSVQAGPSGGAAGEAVVLANADAVNLTGGSGADTFVVTPAATGGPVITVDGGLPAGGAAGDVLDLTTTAGLTVTATNSVTGFNGTVTSGATATVNFSALESFADGATLSGRAFVDNDADGTLDATEGGLSGVTVYLDANANNTLDAGELTATTDANGTFSFAGLPPGNYSVRVVSPAGATLTTSATPAAVNIAALGGTAAAANVGFTLTVGGTVSGVVFADANRDGVRQTGEAGFAGVTVFLDLDGDTQLDPNEPSAVSAADGSFVLNTTANGTFTVRAVAPFPAGFTLPTALPSAVVNGGAAGTTNLRLVPTGAGPTGGSVSGTVFADTVTQNGTRDAGETGVRGVTVYLDLNNDGKLQTGEPTAVTDTNGAYTLTTTTSGTFAVRVVLSPGYLRNTNAPQATLAGGAAVTGTDIGLVANLPPQATPSRRLAAGYIVGGQAHVKTYGPDGQELSDTIVFAGLNIRDVRVSVADVTGDGVDDIIVGTGPGVAAVVIVLDGTNLQQIARLTPFEGSFTGGLYVTAGDLTGDGIADVVVTPDEGGGPRVLIFRGGTAGGAGSFSQVASFFGIDDSNFRGGARAAVADVNRDGTPDLIVAAGFGGGPRISVYDGKTVLTTPTRLFNDFFVFEQTLRNGVYITVGDVDGDGFADVIAGGGPGGGPRVFAISGADLLAGRTPTVLANFFAGNSNDRNGVRLVAKDVDGDGKVEVYTGSGTGNSGRVHRYRGNGGDDGFDVDLGGNTGVFVG